MKKSIFLLPCVTCAVVGILLLASCKKGDAGPAGPAGPPGSAGAGGAAGPAGAPGTANVIYSPWIDTATWKPDTIHTGAVVDTVSYTALINAPKLDLTILNTGEIKVYLDGFADPTDPTVIPLPFNNGQVYFDVLFYLNTVQITSNVDWTDSGLPFRYILVPGGTAARTYKAINWNNYAEVKAYLGLKD